MSMKDVHESPEQRTQRRRARRWRRRGRIVAPFLGIPLLMGTLALSVDLIEYHPQQPRERLSDRPLPSEDVIARRKNEQAARTANAMGITAGSTLATSPSVATADLDLETSALQLDLPPVPTEANLRPPTVPYSPTRSTRMP